MALQPSYHVATLPIIGVSTNVRQLPDYKVHGATERSLHAIYEAAAGLPLMLPALGDKYDFANVVERLDGLLLTGSASHVDPNHYSGSPLEEGETDSERDATTLPLIRIAIAAGLPILALCRGIQELNVALGGTLHYVRDKPLHSSEGKGMPITAWLTSYTHPVTVEPSGVLAGLWPDTATVSINSAHSQSLAVLSPKLRVEARAADGEIEAVSVIGSNTFSIGVQWHPEYMYERDAHARTLFEAFGAAARRRYAQRLLRQDSAARFDEPAPAPNANMGS